MVRDLILNNIVKEIRKEIEKEHKIKLDDDQVYAIVASQYTVIPQAFVDRRTIKIDYFGKLSIKAGREEALTYYKELNEQGIKGEQMDVLMKKRKIERRNEMKPLPKIVFK